MSKTKQSDDNGKQERFDLFVSEFNYWYEQFGLGEWDIDFGQRDNGENAATIETSHTSRTAEVWLDSSFDSDNCTLNDIRLFAKHEALELLLADMHLLMTTDRVYKFEAVEQTHKVINRLIKYMERMDTRG